MQYNIENIELIDLSSMRVSNHIVPLPSNSADGNRRVCFSGGGSSSSSSICIYICIYIYTHICVYINIILYYVILCLLVIVYYFIKAEL